MKSLHLKSMFSTLLSILLSLNLLSQTTDSVTNIFLNKGDLIRLELDGYYAGAISWEESADSGKNWNTINKAVSRNFEFSAEKQGLYRAKIVQGTCKPVYSAYTAVQLISTTANLSHFNDIEASFICILDSGFYHITETGILYDTKNTLTLTSPKISFSKNIQDTFNIKLNQLIPGTRYYARTFAIIDNTTIFGKVISFTTLGLEYSIRQNITTTSAQIKYSFKGALNEEITEHGIIYSQHPDSIHLGSKTIGSYDGIQAFTELTKLQAGTTYYSIPYFIKENDTIYGPSRAFKTFSIYNKPDDSTTIAVKHKIVWNASANARKISQNGVFADYGRVKRFKNSDTLLLVYHGGPAKGDWINIYFRRSFNNGNIWENHQIVMDLANYSSLYWRFCNPEIIVLENGWILLTYEANTKGDENNSSVQIITSKDTGRTWTAPTILKSGRSWEPAMIQLPHGEIELFYSSEAKWWPSVNGSYVAQEIKLIRSMDNGQTWSDPQTVAYYPGKRDGMPVPLLLKSNKGVVFTIETVDNGNSPYIIKRGINENWTLTTSNFDNSPYRWFTGSIGGHGGAPYIVQLSTGETVLSAHRYRGGDWQQSNDMKVMIGDNNAKNFEQVTTPYVLPQNEGAINNSLFVKNDTTLVAISCRKTTDGNGAIFWLEGSILPK